MGLLRVLNSTCANSTHTALPLDKLAGVEDDVALSHGGTGDNNRAKPAIFWCSVPDTCHFAVCLSQLHLVLRDSGMIISVIAHKHVQYQGLSHANMWRDE